MARMTAAVVAALVVTCAVAVPASGASPPAPLSSHVALGAFAPGVPGDLSGVHALEAALGRKLRIVSSYTGWGEPVISAAVRQEVAQGYTPLIAWNIGVSAATRFATFTSGQHDAYLAQVAAAARALGRPVYLRPWYEMNGPWTNFQPTPDGPRPAGGTPAEFIAAWQHVVALFRWLGATNVKWVFNPTTDTYAGTTPVSTIWPGAAYVDVLGLDGYNWGTGGSWGYWLSFHTIYATQYARLTALDPSAPVWICEFGSKEPAEDDGAPVDPLHSKAEWYRDLLADPTFGHVWALVFFNVNKERDWRLQSDPGAVQAVAAAVPR
jgi:hypothetical protein